MFLFLETIIYLYVLLYKLSGSSVKSKINYEHYLFKKEINYL